MTIKELLMMPVGYLPDEWEEELKRRKKVEKRLAKVCDDIEWEIQSLEILKDEIGSERWNKHNNRLYNLMAKKDKLLKEVEGWQ